MPMLSDRVYELEERFPLFKDPKVSPLFSAQSGSFDEKTSDIDLSGSIICEDSFKLRTPFARRSLRFYVDAVTPYPDDDIEGKPVPYDLDLQLGVYGKYLARAGLGTLGKRENGEPNITYTPEQQARLSSLVLVVNNRLLVPDLDDRQFGLTYSQFVDFIPCRIPNVDDIARFKQMKQRNPVRVSRSKEELANLWGTFYWVS